MKQRRTSVAAMRLQKGTSFIQRLEDAHLERLSRGEALGGCFAPPPPTTSPAPPTTPAAAAAAAQHALVSQHLRRLSAAPKQARPLLPSG